MLSEVCSLDLPADRQNVIAEFISHSTDNFKYVNNIELNSYFFLHFWGHDFFPPASAVEGIKSVPSVCQRSGVFMAVNNRLLTNRRIMNFGSTEGP